MRLMILLTICLSGCASLPPAPKIELCALWSKTEPHKGICADTEPKSHVDFEIQKVYTNIDSQGRIKPIEEMHKSICITPDDWQAYVTYVSELKKIIVNQCKK